MKTQLILYVTHKSVPKKHTISFVFTPTVFDYNILSQKDVVD